MVSSRYVCVHMQVKARCVLLLQASYHVGLVQGLLPVVQLLLKESFLLTKQLLQEDVIIYNAGLGRR